MVVELVPVLIVFHQSCVVASIESASVEDDSKQVIDLVIHNLLVLNKLIRLVLPQVYRLVSDHKVLHVQILNRVVDRSILLNASMLTFEPFEGDYQNGRHFVNLYFFKCLLVLLALVTIPFVLLRQFLRPVELPKTISYRHFVDKELLGAH